MKKRTKYILLAIVVGFSSLGAIAASKISLDSPASFLVDI